MLPVEQPFKTFTGKDGKPLNNGYVYFGVPNQNPITSPVTVYWDAEGTIPALQPLRTENGYIVRAGTPANVFFDGAYSELVKDSKDRQVFYARSSDDFSLATTISSFLTKTGSAEGSGLIGFIQDGNGAGQRTVQDELRERVSVTQFGAKGDGTTDDTEALADAIMHVNGTDQCLFFPMGTYKISAALPELTSRGGIKMEVVGYSADGGGAIVPIGSGYTALTVSGSPTNFDVAVAGSGNSVNGILMKNPLLARFGKIRVADLDGFGLKINRCWDSTFEHISIESCGNAAEYAFSMNDDGDTCNMTHVLRLQVEKSNKKSIYVSPNTLSCVIDNIHSEQATPDGTMDTWSLGGNRSTYNNVRLQANAPSANGTVFISAANTTFTSLFVEGDVVVRVEGYSGNELILIGSEIQGKLVNRPNQIGKIRMYGGKANFLAVDPLGFDVRSMTINRLSIGYAGGDATSGSFTDCGIAILECTSSTGAATFVGGWIGYHNDLLQSHTILRGTEVKNTGNGDIRVSYRRLTCYDAKLNANLLVDNGTLAMYGTSVVGGITQTAGPITSIFDSGTTANGAVTGFGKPNGGTWGRGTYTKNMAPAVGSPSGWYKVADGNPGAWGAEANLVA